MWAFLACWMRCRYLKLFCSNVRPRSRVLRLNTHRTLKYRVWLKWIQIFSILLWQKYVMWLQEAVRIFEDFITRLQILQKPLAEEEFKIIRNSIFKVAVALEVFALNYGKHQMTEANSSVEISSQKLGESEHDYSFGFEIIHYLFSDRHIDRWHNGCFHDLIFFLHGTCW